MKLVTTKWDFIFKNMFRTGPTPIIAFNLVGANYIPFPISFNSKDTT